MSDPLSLPSSTATELTVRQQQVLAVGVFAQSTAAELSNILSALYLELAFLEPSQPIDPSDIAIHLERFKILRHRISCYVPAKQLARDRLDWNQILTKCVHLLSHQMRLGKVELVWELDKMTIETYGDTSRVENMVVSLLLSSLQSMRSHGSKLVIRSQTFPQHAMIFIQDNGFGMSEAALSEIFLPTFAGQKDGLGIGLYGCKQIAVENDVELSVSSHLGVGTEFSLRIDFKKEEK